MQNIKKLPLLLVLLLVGAMVLVACGDSTTATTAPTTAAPVATTTAANTATTAATTTTTAATTTTTAATTTTPAGTTTAAAGSPSAAATTTAATSPSATTAAGSTTGPQIAATSTLRKPTTTGGNFTTIGLSAELAPDLHPYVTAANNTQSTTDIATFIYAGTPLVYNFETLKWEYSFASDLKASADLKTFTFTLKDGLKWSDGSAITTADYQFAYDNAVKQDKANPDNDYVGIDDLLRTTSYKAEGKTITVTLDDTYSIDVALSYASIVFPVPTKVWQGKDWRDATKNPEILKPTVVAGAYTVDTYDQKSQAVLKANPNYFRGKPSFDTITLKTGDPSLVLEAVKTGQADWAYNIPSAQYQQAKDDSGVKLYDWVAANATYRYMEYNTARAPFNDKAFRLAMNYAVDKEKLLKLAERGLGTPRSTFVSASSPFYNKNVNDYKYNLDTAKKTLADAGYKTDGGSLLGKDGKPIEITIIFPTTSNPRKVIATALQQDLQALGIKVTVDGKEFQAYVDQATKKDFDLSLGAQGGGLPDPDSFKNTVKGGGTQNNTSYNNPKIDDLFNRGAKELDATKRKAIYDEAQKILNDDSPILFLWDINSFSVFSPKIQGVADSSGKPYSKGDRLDYADAVLTWSKSAQ